MFAVHAVSQGEGGGGGGHEHFKALEFNQNVQCVSTECKVHERRIGVLAIVSITQQQFYGMEAITSCTVDQNEKGLHKRS